MRKTGGWTIREIDRATDAAAVQRLDTSFMTEAVYEVTGERGRLQLGLIAVPTRQGRFAIDLDQPPWDQGFVAVEDGAVRGLVATRLEAWNGRLAIWHFYVDAAHRRRGIGRDLLEQALAAGCRSGARTAWAETGNDNAPGIEAYRRLGFSICGFDLTLYDGTASQGKFAIFLARTLAA
ncbi:MAG TPA: GNAT family N-acetyltransferase [Pirellulales bacterium]|jgi:ribosomal protein S18 acetylase RimI-like enzyme|nr:GNAT family N-acetyltransferase [Pirellulales bacterium]